ncbi:methyltransferase domain-containing protein [Hamadaea sp. NPDC050747]|uniref:class I SAM-dependent methyltransferase n=1 Tax=Hamadaea sp. NPDC050747 TaxID=3155789 RepID=UPI0034074D5A
MTRHVDLISDGELESSSVVANCAMNRERGLTGSNGYGRELGFDVLDELRLRLRDDHRPVRWLDLCSGSGRALLEAAQLLEQEGLTNRAEIFGVDLVDYFVPGLPVPPVRLATASVTIWQPPADVAFDLITCVHGLHYVGDKLSVLTRIAAWLTDTGVFAASFDPTSIRLQEGSVAGRPLTTALRKAGFDVDLRARRIQRRGRAEVTLPFTYLGSDDTAGPNYTGQPAVHSYYSRPTPSRVRESRSRS